MVDRVVEAEAFGDLLIGRVPEHHLAPADQQGHVGDGDLEVVQEVLHAGVPVEVDGRVRMSVARQELLDAERARAMARPHEHDVSQPLRDQLHPAEDEGPHDDLAQLAVGLHERQELLAIQLDHLARLAGARPEKRAAPGEHVDLAAELTRSVQGDERFGGSGRPDDLDLTGGHDEERHDLVARLDEHLPALDLALAPVGVDARDLRRRQRRERLFRG